MKIVAIGIGQCGCNIADEFHAINNYSKSFFGRTVPFQNVGKVE